VVACLSGASVASPASASAAGQDAGTISIVETPAAVAGACLPALFALTNTAVEEPSGFRLRISASAPLCDPIEVTAAIYAMPTDGTQWPQTLVNTRRFTLSGAGVTEVVFTRPCVPAQFDVVTGPTPPEIAPWAEWHGPMLFPFDTGTALQSPGCGGPAPVVPEAPLTLLLPLSAVVLVSGVAAVAGRRRRGVVAG
jgi:hypothetical protein